MLSDVWAFNSLTDIGYDYLDHEQFFKTYPRERFESAQAKLKRLVLRIGGHKENVGDDCSYTSDEDEYTEYSYTDDSDSDVDGDYFYSLAEPCDHDYIKPWCDWCREVADRYGLDHDFY